MVKREKNINMQTDGGRRDYRAREARENVREGGREGRTYHTAFAKACGWRAGLPSGSGAWFRLLKSCRTEGYREKRRG